MVEGAMITGGIALSYWIDFGFSFLEPSSVSWRFPIAFQIVFAILLLIFIMELPESPRVIPTYSESSAFVLTFPSGSFLRATKQKLLLSSLL